MLNNGKGDQCTASMEEIAQRLWVNLVYYLPQSFTI